MPFTDVPGARLYWKVLGRNDAPGLVLLNSIGTDMDLWDSVIPRLYETFRILRIDTRGHGASSAAAGDYTLPMLVRDVLSVADAAGFGRFALAGVSLGGMIAMQLALDHPGKVGRMALVCTSANMDRTAWTDRVEKVRAEGMESIVDLAMARFFSDDFRARAPAVADTIRRQLLTMDPNGYAGCAAAIRDMDLAARLREITVPTLVVTGTRDTSTPFARHGERLLADIPCASHHELDAAHLAPLEAPEALARALLSFLRD